MWKDEQTGSSSSSGWWMTAKDQAPWEPGGPGGFEINSVEPKYIKHDRWSELRQRCSCDGTAYCGSRRSTSGKARRVSSCFRSSHSKLGRDQDKIDGREWELRGRFADTSRKLPSLCCALRRSLRDGTLFSSRTEESFWNEILLLLWSSEQF